MKAGERATLSANWPCKTQWNEVREAVIKINCCGKRSARVQGTFQRIEGSKKIKEQTLAIRQKMPAAVWCPKTTRSPLKLAVLSSSNKSVNPQMPITIVAIITVRLPLFSWMILLCASSSSVSLTVNVGVAVCSIRRCGSRAPVKLVNL